MNTNDFFSEISKPIEGENASLLIEKLFKLAKAISEMKPNDLIALFQALSMMKRQQSIGWFKTNPVIKSINDTQMIVINAMQKHRADAEEFNRVIGDEWVNGARWRIHGPRI